MTCRFHPVSEWLALNGEGQSYSQIGEKYGVTRNTVAGALMRAKKRDYCLEYQRLKYDRDSVIKWASELERREERYSYLLDIQRLTPRKYTIVNRFLQGKNCRDIGREIGITREAVRQNLYSLGIKELSRYKISKIAPAG